MLLLNLYIQMIFTEIRGSGVASRHSQERRICCSGCVAQGCYVLHVSSLLAALRLTWVEVELKKSKYRSLVGAKKVTVLMCYCSNQCYTPVSAEGQQAWKRALLFRRPPKPKTPDTSSTLQTCSSRPSTALFPSDARRDCTDAASVANSTLIWTILLGGGC